MIPPHPKQLIDLLYLDPLLNKKKETNQNTNQNKKENEGDSWRNEGAPGLGMLGLALPPNVEHYFPPDVEFSKFSYFI